ncbi:MAG: hypothetical protein A2W31_09705 [Planctomycetes bacterium RBG_16_64_10]|nr:MAG: hypothetical protein A2W31_09705 [Planctomycetes bacterium RBG_16_64_10]
MKQLHPIIAGLALITFGTSALADHCDKVACEQGQCACAQAATATAEAPCQGGACSLTKTADLATKDQPGCPITAAMAALPKIVYHVGDETTCCSKTAAALAEKSHATVRYAVDQQVFDNERTALVALVEATEKFVDEFATPHPCTDSGTITIAGQSCHCPVEARQTAKLVKDASDQVRMTYLVGAETCHCPNEAEQRAKQTGATTVYVVNGEKIKCRYNARLKLAHAKYRASVEALARAQRQSQAQAQAQTKNAS